MDRLEVHAADGDVVEFTAKYDGPSGPGALHEVSRFSVARDVGGTSTVTRADGQSGAD